jgi:aspartyl-tRNA(Asn)/glutamyl-tRNA(Gln) amidotransferase subunit C
MEVNDLLIENLSRLARLSFNADEAAEIKGDLQQMITFIEKLNEVDTTGVEPLLHMSNNVDILRDDIVKGSVSRAEGLSNAPDTDGIFFKVPKVIKK